MKRLIIPAVFLVFLVACATTPTVTFTPPPTWEAIAASNLDGKLADTGFIRGGDFLAYDVNGDFFRAQQIFFSQKFDRAALEREIFETDWKGRRVVYPQTIRPDLNKNHSLFTFELVDENATCFILMYPNVDQTLTGFAISYIPTETSVSEYVRAVNSISVGN